MSVDAGPCSSGKMRVMAESLDLTPQLSRTERQPDTSWRGGRGCRGPLLLWLIAHRAEVEEARRGTWPRPWRDIAADATRDGVARQHGIPVAELAIRRAWSVLTNPIKPLSKRAVPSALVSLVNATGPAAKNDGLTRPITADTQLPARYFGDGR